MNRAKQWASGRNSSSRGWSSVIISCKARLAARVIATKLRCDSSAPFGAPVEPDVYTIVARSSAFTEAMRSCSSSSETVTPNPSSAPIALESSIRMCFSDAQWSRTESRRSKRSRLSAMASFTAESLRMRSACAAESVS